MKQRNKELVQLAHKLSKEPYSVEIARDETTTGEPMFLLSHPELPGCMAQGWNIEEALDNLKDATKEYILSILEDGLAVPEPSVKAGATTTITSNYQDDYPVSEPDFLDQLQDVAQPLGRQKLVEITSLS